MHWTIVLLSPKPQMSERRSSTIRVVTIVVMTLFRYSFCMFLLLLLPEQSWQNVWWQCCFEVATVPVDRCWEYANGSDQSCFLRRQKSCKLATTLLIHLLCEMVAYAFCIMLLSLSSSAVTEWTVFVFSETAWASNFKYTTMLPVIIASSFWLEMTSPATSGLPQIVHVLI